MHPTFVCSVCGEPVDRRSARVRPGPGAHPGDFDRTALAATGTVS